MRIIWKPSTARYGDVWLAIADAPTPMPKKPMLQLRLDVYWLIHNFIYRHFTTKQVPAIALGILDQRLSWPELFQIRLFPTGAP